MLIMMNSVSLILKISIFIGPILLPLLITYFETFKERFNKKEPATNY